MKRYKQSILSDYFVTSPEGGVCHIVGANYDIEDQSNLTLCGHHMHDDHDFEVLANRFLAMHLGNGRVVCHACKVILYQRIANMPGQLRVRAYDDEPRQFELPVYQLGLDI